MMQYISKNPYRILGLLANSTKKEQAKQVNRLKHFIEAEVETDEDFSFPSLGKFDRTQEILNEPEEVRSGGTQVIIQFKDDQDVLDYLVDLRTNILNCYSTIISGAKDAGK